VKRVILVVALLWLVVAVFPGAREAASPRAVELRDWTWGHLQGPLSPVTDRYRRIRAEAELSEAARLLVLDRNQGRRAPRQEELAAFLARHEVAPDGLDPWGTPYQLSQQQDSLVIRSAGPDLRYETGDDVLVKVLFPDRSRPQRPFR
jgi:hypothetical protein